MGRVKMATNNYLKGIYTCYISKDGKYFSNERIEGFSQQADWFYIEMQWIWLGRKIHKKIIDNHDNFGLNKSYMEDKYKYKKYKSLRKTLEVLKSLITTINSWYWKCQ